MFPIQGDGGWTGLDEEAGANSEIRLPISDSSGDPLKSIGSSVSSAIFKKNFRECILNSDIYLRHKRRTRSLK